MFHRTWGDGVSCGCHCCMTSKQRRETKLLWMDIGNSTFSYIFAIRRLKGWMKLVARHRRDSLRKVLRMLAEPQSLGKEEGLSAMVLVLQDWLQDSAGVSGSIGIKRCQPWTADPSNDWIPVGHEFASLPNITLQNHDEMPNLFFLVHHIFLYIPYICCNGELISLLMSKKNVKRHTKPPSKVANEATENRGYQGIKLAQISKNSWPSLSIYRKSDTRTYQKDVTNAAPSCAGWSPWRFLRSGAPKFVAGFQPSIDHAMVKNANQITDLGLPL